MGRVREAARTNAPAAAKPESTALPMPKPKKLKPLLPPQVDPDLAPKAARIAEIIDKMYPNPAIPLNLARATGQDHARSNAFELLAACLLSAQSTDAMVNRVTGELFGRWPTPREMSQANASDVEDVVRCVGLAPQKSKNLVNLSKILVAQHNNDVPASWEALEALPGVGHKTASVVMAQAFGLPAFPVDTHIHRLAQRWGLSNGHSVEQTEADFKSLLPPHTWHDVHLQLIYFGREHCPAVGHDPSGCPICAWAAVPPYHKPGASPARPGQKPKAVKKQAPQPPATPQQQEQGRAKPKAARKLDVSTGEEEEGGSGAPPSAEKGAAAGSGSKKRAAASEPEARKSGRLSRL